ncbi:MAG: hypothetical protein ABSG25_00055 [Bryobacteraceae bacterium]
MSKKLYALLALSILIAAFAVPQTAAAQTVVITPASVVLYANGSQIFTVTVPSGGNSAVQSWSLSPNVGTIVETGPPMGQQARYTAPSSIVTPQTVTVTACLASNPNACGTATVTLVPAVVISPSAVTLYANGSQVFTVSVPSGGNSAVGSWTISPNVGTIVETGPPMGQQARYTAPSSIYSVQTVTVKACLASNSNLCGTATVTLMPYLIISPSAVTLYPGQCQALTITTPDGSNSAAGSWTLNPNLGTLQWIAPLGQLVEYCAPSSIPTPVLVTATACLASNPTHCGPAWITLLP